MPVCLLSFVALYLVNSFVSFSFRAIIRTFWPLHLLKMALLCTLEALMLAFVSLYSNCEKILTAFNLGMCTRV